MDLLASLNTEQRKAVVHADGALLILAGAGSGKTRVIAHRVAWLVLEGHARPDEILAVTFTNKAAEEMRTRVEGLLDRDCRTMWISTFHALCARLLRREAHHLGLSRSFTIYDSADQQAVVKQLVRELPARRGHLPAADGAVAHQPRQEPHGGPRDLHRRLEPARQGDRPALRRIHQGAGRRQRRRLRRPAAQVGRAVRPRAGGPRALRAPLPLRDDRRVPGHQPAAVPRWSSSWSASTATCASSATPTSRSTSGAAPTSATSSTSSTTSPTRSPSSSSATIVRRR